MTDEAKLFPHPDVQTREATLHCYQCAKPVLHYYIGSMRAALERQHNYEHRFACREGHERVWGVG